MRKYTSPRSRRVDAGTWALDSGVAESAGPVGRVREASAAEVGLKPRVDLSERTFAFARNIMAFTRVLRRHVVNDENTRQLVRAAGSVGANYIEANESLSHKDFVVRLKICRKEAKESVYWLRLVDVPAHATAEREALTDEGTQLVRIFSAIINRSAPS